jgi:hypothetical protein
MDRGAKASPATSTPPPWVCFVRGFNLTRKDLVFHFRTPFHMQASLLEIHTSPYIG